MLQVYTGTGKGKTTAALGAALRCAGYGKKTIMFAFLKGDKQYGEVRKAAGLDFLTIHLVGRDEFVNFRCPDVIDLEMVRNGWDRVCEALKNRDADLIILDEMNLVLATKMLPLAQVLPVLEQYRHEVEIIITGRNAPRELTDIADLVTDMQEVKHYLSRGIITRDGFDH